MTNDEVQKRTLFQINIGAKSTYSSFVNLRTDQTKENAVPYQEDRMDVQHRIQQNSNSSITRSNTTTTKQNSTIINISSFYIRIMNVMTSLRDEPIACKFHSKKPECMPNAISTPIHSKTHRRNNNMRLQNCYSKEPSHKHKRNISQEWMFECSRSRWAPIYKMKPAKLPSFCFYCEKVNAQSQTHCSSVQHMLPNAG